MNDTTEPAPGLSPSSPPPSGEPRGGGVLSWLAMVVAAVSLVMSGMLWQKLGQAQQELARQSADSAEDANEARTLAGQAEALTQELQARLSVAEVRVSEVSLQRSQLEELMLSVSRSRDDNLVQDLESTLRLAQQQAQLTGSVQPLVSALQSADQRISRAAQPRLNPVQRAIARDIERIKAATLTDVPALVQRLDELARQTDDLTAANAVQRAPARAPARPRAAAPVSAAETDDTLPEAPAPQGWAKLVATWNRLWDRASADVGEQVRELVRVSRIDDPEAMLLAPEQVFLLRQNLKIQLLNARLALLARQLPAAQSDVAAAARAVQRYFDAEAQSTRAMLAGLAQVQGGMKTSELPRPEETLSALSVAAGGR